MKMSTRMMANLIWLVLMSFFALVIVYPSVTGFSNLASLSGWLVALIAISAHVVLMTECMTAEKNEDPAKREKALQFLRDVNAKLAAHSKWLRLRGDLMLFALVVLVAFTGSIALAVAFIVARFLRAASEHTSIKTVAEHDEKAGKAAAAGGSDHQSPTAAPAN